MGDDALLTRLRAFMEQMALEAGVDPAAADLLRVLDHFYRLCMYIEETK